MAGFFDRLNQGLTNLSQSPAGMAGMGLLMMPSQSLTPINPFEYAARGMQQGVQNRQRAQTLSALQERQRQEDEYRQMRYLMRAQEYQQEMLKQEETKRQNEEQRKNQEAYISGITDPAQAALARALGPGYMKLAAEAALKPQGQASLPRSIQEFQEAQKNPAFAQFLSQQRAPQRAPAPERPMSPGDLARLQGPEGATLPFGITPSQAGQMGATVRPEPTTPRLSATEATRAKAKYDSAMQLKRQIATARQNFEEARNEMASTGRVGGLMAITPAAQKFDKSIDAMRSTVTSLTRTPGVGAMSDYETRLDQAKMPARSNYDEVTEQQLMELEALADGVLMGYGEMMGGAQQGAPQGKQEGGWMTLPNGVRVRRKQ